MLPTVDCLEKKHEFMEAKQCTAVNGDSGKAHFSHLKKGTPKKKKKPLYHFLQSYQTPLTRCFHFTLQNKGVAGPRLPRSVSFFVLLRHFGV